MVFDFDVVVYEFYVKGGVVIGFVSEVFGDVLSDGVIDWGELFVVFCEDLAGFGKFEVIVYLLVEVVCVVFVVEVWE